MGLGRQRVVIVGAGFGGLACARRLNGQPVDVLLVDRQNFHLFAPLLYQVATALLNPSDIAYPLRTIFRRSTNVRVRQAEVLGVDTRRKQVSLQPGGEVVYDHLVLATGSTDNFFGNREVARVALGLKSLEDATRLRNHVLRSFELADAEADPDRRRELLTFVVAGGGPTGVEYAGALRELADLVAGRDYRGFTREEIRILLVEGRERLLPAFSDRLGRYAGRVLSSRGVQVRTGTLVRAAAPGSVTLSSGEVIPTRTIVWSAGVRPQVPDAATPLPRTPSRRLEVDDHLRLTEAPRVYALGDAAGAAGASGELPGVSAVAMQAGRYVARSILAEVRSRREPQPAFRYVDRGSMATIGRNAAVARLAGGLELTGFLGWLAWIFVHVYYLVGFRNRMMAMAGWAWNYIRIDRPIRLVLRAAASDLMEPDETG